MKSRYSFLFFAGALTLLSSLPAWAEEEVRAHLLIELNAAESQQDGCKLSFLALNGHPVGIAQAVFETVIFDAAGQVDRLTLLDFSDLPAARPRVRQFMIADMQCGDIGRILFNGASTCQSPRLGDDACEAGLMLESKTDIEVTG